jgi:UDP-glucose 4-epimerase
LGFTKYYDGGAVSMKRNVIRPGYTYSNPPFPDGSSQADTRFKDIAEAVAAGNTVKVIKNDGTQFISAGEIAKLYLGLLESDKNEEVYLALGNVYTTWEKIAQIALEEYPESKSEIVLNDLGWGNNPSLYGVKKMERDFGLSYDSQKDLREHIKWNLTRALSK